MAGVTSGEEAGTAGDVDAGNGVVDAGTVLAEPLADVSVIADARKTAVSHSTLLHH